MDDDFDNMEMNDEEWEQNRKEREKKIKSHPLMKQAKELMLLLATIIETSKHDDEAEKYCSLLSESIMVINGKLYASLDSESYLICMQSAAIIRDHAKQLLVSCHMMLMLEISEEKYLNLFRDEMEKFRALFVDWAKEIKFKEGDIEDEWGLFLK